MATHEGIERFFTDEELAGVRKNYKGRTPKLIVETGDEDVDIRVEAFMTGALFMRAVVSSFVNVQIAEADLLAAAYQFYPPYEPLSEPTKISTSERRADGIEQK